MPIIKFNGMTYAGSPIANSLPFDDTNTHLGTNNIQDAIEAMNEILVQITNDLKYCTKSSTVKNFEIVSSLPSDASSHTDTIYIVTE